MNRIEMNQTYRENLSSAEDLYAFAPSRELAWIMGVLVGGGYSNPFDKKISLDSENEEFLREFKSIGERVFNVNGSFRTKRAEGNTRRLKGVVFHSKRVTEAIGDLRGSEWPSTISDQHKWIIENPNYLWGFIEGMFERKGNIIMSNGRAKCIFMGTDYVNAANFLAEILVNLGIEMPTMGYSKRGKEGVKEVRICARRDLQHFAQNVHSKIPEKEERLSILRELNPRNRRRPISINTPVSEEEVIQEWLRLKELLGHIPKSEEISNLKAREQTRFSKTVYRNRFGGGNFDTARENIERIIRERQETTGSIENSNIENSQEIQIFSMNKIEKIQKIHRSPEWWAKRKLEALIEESSRPTEEVVLFGPDNQSLIPSRKDQSIPPRSQRPINLVNFVREEIEKFRLGELEDISFIEDLRIRFGYSNERDVLYHISKAGLTEQRRQVKKEKHMRDERVVPSDDLAWMLGVLANGGYVDPMGKIVLSSCEDEDLAMKFKSIGEQLFKSEGYIRELKWPNRNPHKRIEFSDIRSAHMMGNLNRTQWPQTIEEKHSWILADKKYMWSFLRGVFDTRGSPTENKPRIRINTTSLNIANFVSDLLIRVGIEDIKLVHSSFTPEKIMGVSIGHLKDLKLFGENIQSSAASKDRILEVFRQKPLSRIRELTVSDEEVIEEWENMKSLLGHPPSLLDILELEAQGKTKYSPSVYAARFGISNESKKGRIFSEARETLERITFSRNVNEHLGQYENQSSRQIRYTPKLHLFP